MNNNKMLVWLRPLGIGLLLISIIVDRLQGPAKNDMLSWFFIGVSLIALGMSIVYNKEQVWFQISIGGMLVVIAVEILQSPVMNHILAWVSMGLALIIFGWSIVAAMKNTKQK